MLLFTEFPEASLSTDDLGITTEILTDSFSFAFKEILRSGLWIYFVIALVIAIILGAIKTRLDRIDRVIEIEKTEELLQKRRQARELQQRKAAERQRNKR